MEKKTIIKLSVFGIILALLVITGLNCCSIIEPTEEAVIETLGTLNEENLGQGLHFKAPYVQKFRTIDKNPIEYEKTIPLGEKALITKDGQSLGIQFTMTWKYRDGSAYEVAKRFSNRDSIYNLISNPCKQSFKSEIGKLEALEFVGKQDDVISQVIARVGSEAVRLNLPIEVLNIVIDNITWDSGFEAQIKKTAEMRAQVEQANQDALKEAANAQKKVALAKADKEAAEENANAFLIQAQKSAEAELVKAQKSAEAKKVEADAIAYYNAKVAQNLDIQKAQWKHEEEMARLEKWDGVQVSSQSIYVPNTYDLKSGK
jgi:regulator of protease activity HflC (stomatin/prohibitin superfamily)